MRVISTLLSSKAVVWGSLKFSDVDIQAAPLILFLAKARTRASSSIISPRAIFTITELSLITKGYHR